MGGRRSKLLQAVVNLEPSRAPFVREEGASPEGVSAPGVSQRAPGGGRTGRRWRGEKPKTSIGGEGPRGLFALAGGEAEVWPAHVLCLGSLVTVPSKALAGPTLPPPPSKFDTWLGLGIGALCVGGGALSVANRELQGRAAGCAGLRRGPGEGRLDSYPLLQGDREAPATSAFLREPVPYPLPSSTAPSPPPVLLLSRSVEWVWGGG